MIGRTQRIALGVIFAVALLAPVAALAGPSGGNSTTDSNVNLKDLYYDFELWWVYEVPTYYVIAKFEDGHVETYEFPDHWKAEDFIEWLYFHIVDFESASIELGSKTVKEYLDTYDTRAEAKHWGLALPGGYEIVPVSVFGTTTISNSRG